MKKNLILKIKIETNGEAASMKFDGGEVLMIPFKGHVDGPLFFGEIVPCGVDTQIVNAAGVRHMSARYMLVGKDMDGESARIYVENNGWFDDAAQTGPFRTVPTFYTDSKKLAPYLSGNQFVGEGVEEKDGLWIYFYEFI